MRQIPRFFLFISAFFLCSDLRAQISNDETNISIVNGPDTDTQTICPGFNPPSGTYTIKVIYRDLETGDETSTGDLPCTVTNNGSQILINVPTANFPTATNTWLEYDFSETNGYLTLNGASSFYLKWFQTQYSCGFLPVTLTTFTATRQTTSIGGVQYAQVKLDWQTASESNSKEFIVERSNTGTNFSRIAAIASQADAYGNSNSPLDYQFIDQFPIKGNNYYRLKCVDRDGNFKYSEIRLVNLSAYNVQSPSKDDCSYINIQGPANICGTEGNYGFSSIPDYNFPVTWSITPSNIAQVQSTGSGTAKVTWTNTGLVTLQATLNNCTDATKTRTKTIQLGRSYINIESYVTSSSYSSTSYSLSVKDQYGNYLICDWYKNNVFIGSGTNQSATAYMGSSCDSYKAVYDSPCGVEMAFFNACHQTTPCGDGVNCETLMFYTVSPVPSGDVMTISSNPSTPGYKEFAAKSSEIYTLQIYDMHGNMKKERKKISLKSPYQLSVRDLPNGNYVLILLDKDNKKIQKQVRIER